MNCLVNEALFFVLNQIYFYHFNNEKEAYLYSETAPLKIGILDFDD